MHNPGKKYGIVDAFRLCRFPLIARLRRAEFSNAVPYDPNPLNTPAVNVFSLVNIDPLRWLTGKITCTPEDIAKQLGLLLKLGL